MGNLFSGWSWKTILFGGAVLALVAAAIVLNARRPIVVKTAVPQKDVSVRVFGIGAVEARVLSQVGFETSAAITELDADHGDAVKRGEVLARLHSAEQEAKVARAKAALDSAQANEKKAEAAVAKARAVQEQRAATNRRRQELVGRGAASLELAEEAERDEAVARADLAVALSDVEVAKSQVEDARAALRLEEILLAHHTLTAPFDAIVVERAAELGAVVKAGDPIFTLVAPETVWALAYIDEARAGFIREGQPAEVRLRSLPQQALTARVARIGIESDRVSEERRVYVKCEQCPPSFFLGEQAEVLITVATLDDALLVPENAVRGFDGATGSVWTVKDGALRARVVKFRHRTEDSMLEIVGGVPDGAQVVLEARPGLEEGRSARAEPAGAAR